MWELYQARGFVFPGLPGSAPPLLAQHDWVHVLADYGTTVENELEAFAFIARANDDPHGFSLLAMVISLFETGYLRADAGLFEYDTGHLSKDPRVVVRLADAMRRGALCSDERRDDDSVDFLRLDWFELAPLALAEVRRLLHVVPKSDAALRSGIARSLGTRRHEPVPARRGCGDGRAGGAAYDGAPGGPGTIVRRSSRPGGEP